MSGNVICDLDGVVYRGSRAIPGAAEALRELQWAGVNLLFCTNNSSRRPSEVASAIEGVTGFSATSQQVLGSAAAAATLLADEKPVTYVLGGAGIVAALADVGVEMTEIGAEAQAVVVGIDLALSYDRLRQASQAAASGARLIATNNDPTYPAEDGFWPGAGSMLAAVETASGRKAEVAGKPYRPMRDLIRSRLVPGRVWVVGDRPDTDLALAQAEQGWESILVLTGVVKDPEGVTPPPDFVAEDLPGAVSLILSTD
ncbi:MAG: HAD-IIA family hydrolase [Acidimicrobiia bacterium]